MVLLQVVPGLGEGGREAGLAKLQSLAGGRLLRRSCVGVEPNQGGCSKDGRDDCRMILPGWRRRQRRAAASMRSTAASNKL